jgi:hypothetical protein
LRRYSSGSILFGSFGGLPSVESGVARERAVWRDDLDERRATIKMEIGSRGEPMMPALIVVGKRYASG